MCDFSQLVPVGFSSCCAFFGSVPAYKASVGTQGSVEHSVVLSTMQIFCRIVARMEVNMSQFNKSNSGSDYGMHIAHHFAAMSKGVRGIGFSPPLDPIVSEIRLVTYYFQPSSHKIGQASKEEVAMPL